MNKATDANNFMPAGMTLLGLTPAIMVLLPWDFGPEMTAYRGFMRGQSLTVTLIEMAIVVIAATRGFSPFSSIRSLSKWSIGSAAMFVLVVVYGIATSAKVPIFGAIGLAKICVHTLFFLAVSHLLASEHETWRARVWHVIGFGLLAYWILWLINIWIFKPQGQDWIFLVPGVTHVRSLGFFALAGFFAGLALTMPNGLDERGRLRLILGPLVSTAALVMVFWTGSRGGLLAIMSGISFTLFLAQPLRKWLAKFSLVVLTISILISLSLPTPNPIYGLNRIVSSSTQVGEGKDVLSGRGEMWKQTVAKISERPLVGWGLEQFAVSGPDKTLGYKQPHNWFLQMLFATGLLGTIAALFCIGPFFRRLSWKVAKPDRLAAWGYIGGAATFGLYDAAFYYTYPVMIFLLAVASVLKPFVPPYASDRSG